MIKIYTLSLFLLIGLIGYSQSNKFTTYSTNIFVDTNQYFITDSIIEELENYTYYPLLNFNSKERKIISSHISDFNNQWLICDDKIILPTHDKASYLNFKTYDNKKYYFLNRPDSNYIKLTNDSIIVNHDSKYVLNNVLFAYNSLENWEITNKSFNKKSLINSFDILLKNNSIESLAFKKSSKSKITNYPFKENVVYHYIFSDKKNELTFKQPYKEHSIIYSHKLIKNHISKLKPNEFYHKFVYNIIKNIKNKNYSIYNLNNIKIDYTDTLFLEPFLSEQLDENNYPIYDEFGDAIFITIYDSFNYSDIIGIQFNEDWYLAKNQFDIVKKVNSISFLVKNVHPETGDLLPEPKVLPFKIKFND